MALATGGVAVGAINTRSSPSSWAFRRAWAVGMISEVPSGNTARTSRARMDSFTFSLRFCLRGGKFLPGYMLCDWLRIAEGTRQGLGALESSRVERYGASERQAQLRQLDRKSVV